MNWYKKTQQIEINEGRPGSYLDYGHDAYKENQGWYNSEYNPENPNFIWMFVRGEIDVEKETPDTPGHGEVNRWYDIEDTYSGRYSSKDKIITLVRPSKGPRHFRSIPYSIQFELRRAFPEATQIKVY